MYLGRFFESIRYFLWKRSWRTKK